jgi:hypothetical protein
MSMRKSERERAGWAEVCGHAGWASASARAGPTGADIREGGKGGRCEQAVLHFVTSFKRKSALTAVLLHL